MPQRKRKHGRSSAAAARPRPAATATITDTPGESTAPRLSVEPGATPPRREPVTQNEFLARYAERARVRDDEARAKLVPLAPGERPWPIVASVIVCFVLALANLVLFLAGVKVGSKPPGAGELIAFVVLMSVCGIGMWVLWFQAVLAFMVLLGILIVYFCLFLVEASNLLAVVYPIIIIGLAGFMFWKLIRVLARLQMPERRSRAARS